VVFKRETLTFDPSRVFVFVDEQEASIDDGHFLVWRAPDRRWINMPTDRHRRSGGFSFADGHVEFWRWQWPKVYWKQVEYWKPVENEKDLADLRRLQAAVVDP
jgi:prepilin-type processing-associated H-X9-DG protein